MSPRPPEALPVVRAADLDELDPARRWLIEPLWIHDGVGTIGGLPKSCKSWMGLDMAVSVASGTPCLDSFPVRNPGTVLLYMAEDAGSLVKARLHGICRHRGLKLNALPIDVITAPQLRLDLPVDQQRLAETVRRSAPCMLLLDPFVRLHQANENQAGEVAAILGYLRALQRAHHVAVIVTHHARKNGSANGGVSLRGSGDFFAWVDTALSLRRRQHTLQLSVEHRAAAAPEAITLALLGDEQNMHLGIVDEQQQMQETTPADLDTTILDALQQAGDRGLTRASLRSTLHVRNERLGQALPRLAAAGQLAQRGDRWVAVPRILPIDTQRNGNRNLLLFADSESVPSARLT
jgi:RecA-family ATPase